MALRDPDMIAAAQMPFLPAPMRPVPQISEAPVFDARAMVESTKRKVDNPVYGAMPGGTAEGRAAADAARAQMRRRRRRNRAIAWVFAVVFLGVVAGAGYLAYRAYQDDRDRQQAASSDASSDTSDPAALSPLGQEVEALDALDAVNSAATPAAGGLVGAIDDAKAAVGQGDTRAPSASSLALGDVLPPEVLELARPLDPVDGFTRYVVAMSDLEAADQIAADAWVARLQSLPQATSASPGLAVLPAVEAGHVAIAVQAIDGLLTRLVVVGVAPDISVDQ